MYCAMQFAAQESSGLLWERHPVYYLGCKENAYCADFRVWTPEIPTYDYSVLSQKNDSLRRTVPIPDGFVVEVKGPVQTGVWRRMMLWKAHGPAGIPLVIMTAAGGTPIDGLKQRWTRRVIVPDGENVLEKSV
jgi:hypothetical protein